MPELPEVTAYVEAFRSRIVGFELQGIRIRSPSLLRSVDPPLREGSGRTVRRVFRLGKRIVWELDDDLFMVFHLMVTGRFHRKPPGAALPRRRASAYFDFVDASHFLTEAGKQKRATLHLLKGRSAVSDLDRGGLEPLEASRAAFASAIRRENRTLKRALTDPRILSGIGNSSRS
jgi:formamidopyrimidine-DNA glycosylase